MRSIIVFLSLLFTIEITSATSMEDFCRHKANDRNNFATAEGVALMGQVKGAYHTAHFAGFANPLLNGRTSIEMAQVSCLTALAIYDGDESASKVKGAPFDAVLDMGIHYTVIDVKRYDTVKASIGEVKDSRKDAIAPPSGVLDYRIDKGQFFTSKGKIPVGCVGQLMTELNGDNSVAAIYIDRASLRGCVDANYPYPGGNEAQVSYSIKGAVGVDIYKLSVCQTTDGSMGAFCDQILVKFTGRHYTIEGKTKEVLSLEKIGEW